MDVLALQNRLRQLDDEISERTHIIFDHVTSSNANRMSSSEPVSSSEDDEWLTPEFIDQLWLLKSGFDEAQSLLDQQNMLPFSQIIDKIGARVADFEAAHPETLLAVDMSRKIRALKFEAAQIYERKWHEIVQWKGSSLIVKPHDDAEEDEQTLKASAQLTNEFAQKHFGHHILKPVMSLNIKLKRNGAELVCEDQKITAMRDLYANLDLLIDFVASFPPYLSSLVTRNWGSFVVTELTRVALITLFPDSPTPGSYKEELAEFSELEKRLKANEWTNSNEISMFIKNFDTYWKDYRREKYLVELRNLYQKSTPINEETREKLVGEPPREAESEQSEKEENDWDWDGDDDEETSDNTEGNAVNAQSDEATKTEVASKGRAVDIWLAYSKEVDQRSPEPFFTLYRAIVPTAYRNNALWIYADTTAFVAHVQHAASHPDVGQLVQFANDHLQKYTLNNIDQLQNSLLPRLFASAEISAEVLSQIRSIVDEVAMSTNNVGGPELRQNVLRQLVEQIAVYVIQYVESLADIGDSEGQQLAIMITKLSSLAIYFEDANAYVPSWTKLDMLKEILTNNLASIEDLNDRGVLGDYTPDELTGLVKALFVESPMRKAVIRKFYS